MGKVAAIVVITILATLVFYRALGGARLRQGFCVFRAGALAPPPLLRKPLPPGLGLHVPDQ